MQTKYKQAIFFIALFFSLKKIIAQNVGIGTPAATAKAQLEVIGAGGLRVYSTNPSLGVADWIAGNFGYSSTGDRVVIGNLASQATIGAHNNALDAWAPLYVNTAGGAGGPVSISTSATTFLGNTFVASLAGATTRMVIVNNTGLASTQAIPIAPTIIGTNGIISIGNNLQMGGTLTQNTTINQNLSTLSFMANTGLTNLIASNGKVSINYNQLSYTLYVNGTLAGTGAYVNLSDRRFKKNIEPIENALQKILQLRGVSFNWDLNKAGNKNLLNNNHIGFIAQEIGNILPQVVDTASDSIKTKSVAYNDVIPVIVEAIKQQQKQTEQQQKQVDELKMLFKKNH